MWERKIPTFSSSTQCGISVIVGWGHRERPHLPPGTPPSPSVSLWELAWPLVNTVLDELWHLTASHRSVAPTLCTERMAVRILEIIFFLYFASHIPITLFIDLQALLPEHVYPQQVGVRGKPKLSQTLQSAGSLHVVCFLPPAERCSEVVLRGLQGPDGCGPSRMVQVFHLLRSLVPAAFLPHCGVRFPQRSVNATREYAKPVLPDCV